MSAAATVGRPASGRWQPGSAALGQVTGWVALVAWSGMVAEPVRFLVPTLVIALVLGLVGSGLRVLRLPAYAVLLAQLVLALLALNLVFAARESRLGVLPTMDSVRRVGYAIYNGGATLNSYAAPVEVNPTHTAALLTVCGLAVLLSIDLLAFGVRRPALAALPLLAALSVPVSILDGALGIPVFVGTAVLFLRLLAVEHLDQVRSWGSRPRSWVSLGGSMSALWQVAGVAIVGALLLAPLVPVTDLLDRKRGGGSSGAGAGSYQLSAVNPFVRLRRDLVTKTNTPMVYAETESRSTSYLRTTVLDRFTENEWRPSRRVLPADNSADGVFPSPPGLGTGIGGSEDRWSLQLARGFSTTWLPLPYPIRELEVPGTWRYDSRTLDVASVGETSAGELSYTATAFTPAITARLLDGALEPPDAVRAANTGVPDTLPEVIIARAEEVTRGASTDYAKAVALQDWFRRDGGFRYSLEQRAGSGMDLLARFVTDDRVGYCEQFASAMAAMGRALDIPSRVVVGFLSASRQADGRLLYTSDDRHAWPEMYFSGVGWVRFEPTPGQRAGATPVWTRQSLDAPDPTAAPSASASPTTDADADAAAANSSAEQWSLPVPAWSVAALLVVLSLGLVPALVRRSQRRRRLAGHDPVHLAEGAWAELRATAVDLGLEWPERRTPREQARTVAGQVHADEDAERDLEDLLTRVERGRYARPGTLSTVAPQERSQTVEVVRTWRRAMAGSVDRGRGRRGRWWPGSLLRRRG